MSRDTVRELMDFMGGNATVTGGRVYFPERKLRELLRSAQDALARQPAACPKCDGTGEADSGGVMSWGAPAMIPCECQQPAAVDGVRVTDEMVQRGVNAYWESRQGRATGTHDHMRYVLEAALGQGKA